MRSLALLALIGIGCGPSGPQTPEQQAAARGRSFYTVNCTACHNPNPSLSGPLGPPVNGSSLELLEARVLRGEYPPGYKPKRATRIMVPLPHLRSHIPDLAAYLK